MSCCKSFTDDFCGLVGHYFRPTSFWTVSMFVVIYRTFADKCGCSDDDFFAMSKNPKYYTFLTVIFILFFPIFLLLFLVIDLLKIILCPCLFPCCVACDFPFGRSYNNNEEF